MRAIATTIACAAAATTTVAVGPVMSEQRQIVIGVLCDRTGPTQIVGVNMCPAYHDYMNLVNQRGGVERYKIKADEIDVEYKVPPAVEAYGRQKAEGAVSIMIYGTPQTQALTQKLNEDKIAAVGRQRWVSILSQRSWALWLLGYPYGGVRHARFEG